MASVNNKKSTTPSKSRLARTFAKVMHIRAVTGITPVDGTQKSQPQENLKHEEFLSNNTKSQSISEDDEKTQQKAAKEAFVAKLFASVSTIKAAYAQLQSSQSPYDPDGIQSSDQMVVSELKILSELKQSYVKNHFDESSPETTQLLAEIQEQKSLLKTYEITGKKLDSQVKLKNSEITFLKEKLEEAHKENRLLEKRMNSSGQLSFQDNLHLSELNPNHFIAVLKQTVKSIRSFVRVMISEMESSGWDLDSAASSIQSGVNYWSVNHKCFAFESFVSREMFDGFNYPRFSLRSGSVPDRKKQQQQYFIRFMELKSMRAREYLARKSKSTFAEFCRTKYLQLVHPKMESSLFGDLKQRDLVISGKFPETTFFAMFLDMAKRVWLLHCLAFSFDPVASIFQVANGCRFSEVYMESVTDESFLNSSETDHRVAFMVVPGFKIRQTTIQCQVYLS